MKKANRKDAIKNSRSAQKSGKKPAARSSRAGTRKARRNTIKLPKQKNSSAETTEVKAAERRKRPNSAHTVKGYNTVTGLDATERKKSSLSTNLLRVVALLAVIGITLFIYSIRTRVEEFERFGYAGAFLIALMANATVLLPAPGVAIIYTLGAVFNPLGVGLAAGTGGALGELSGYFAGFSGQAIIERTDIYNRFQPWVNKHGGWAILVLSAIPNPFFDVAGIAAGIAKMPMRTFLLFTWVGQIIKMSSFAIAGYYSLEWLTNFFR